MKNPFKKKEDKSKADRRESGDAGASEFGEKFAKFFSAEPQKEKILKHEDFAKAGDTYYASVSARFKIAERVFIVLLTFFLLFSIFTNIKAITYGNFFYFFRDFGNAIDIESTNYETLSYDVYKKQKFSLYRGGIAAVSPSCVSVYTATGRRTLKDHAEFSDPYAVCSDKFVLVYDMTGSAFSIYNSFSKVYSETLDAPISDAYISDSGVFAVLTRSTEYRSVVMVYNDDMKPIGKYSKNNYAMDISIDADGERMAVLYYDVGDGRGRTTVRVYDISERKSSPDVEQNENRILSEIYLDNVFPLSCSFLNNGKLSVITDHSVNIYDEKYKLDQSVTYSEQISALYASERGVAVAVSSGVLDDINRIIVFDKDGRELYDKLARGAVREISVLDRYVFIRSDISITRLDTKNGGEEKYDIQNGKMLVYDESTAIVCTESKAVYIKFKST